MKTRMECIPCFFNQALNLASLSGAGEEQTREIINRLSNKVSGFSFSSSPPELSRTIYKIAADVTGISDPYKEMKQKSNAAAIKTRPRTDARLTESSDRLLTAVELAIAGNIIDYGVSRTLDLGAEIDKILSMEERKISREATRTFDYGRFKQALAGARRIMYLADNAGEIFFDRVLMEEILSAHNNVKITCAVKEKPIINDALMEDALDCGIDGCAELISSGSDAPGTILHLCSGEFLSKLESCDMVISKGQGNFEGFRKEGIPVFYLFMAKCPAVALEAGCSLGDINLLEGGR